MLLSVGDFVLDAEFVAQIFGILTFVNEDLLGFRPVLHGHPDYQLQDASRRVRPRWSPRFHCLLCRKWDWLHLLNRLLCDDRSWRLRSLSRLPVVIKVRLGASERRNGTLLALWCAVRNNRGALGLRRHIVHSVCRLEVWRPRLHGLGLARFQHPLVRVSGIHLRSHLETLLAGGIIGGLSLVVLFLLEVVLLAARRALYLVILVLLEDLVV